MTWPAPSLVALGALYAAVAVVGAYILFLFLLLLVVMRRAGARRAAQAVSAEVRPRLQAALVDFLAGSTEEKIFREHFATHPSDVAESILLYQATMGGNARERLCGLALDLGLVRQWCAESGSSDARRRRAAFANLAFACVYEPCLRVAGEVLREAVKDDDEEVRISACQGLVQDSDGNQAGLVFGVAIEQNLLSRIVLTEALRRHALALAAGPVREALRTGDAARVRATLEILVGWERAIPLEELGEFLEHADRDIRLLAFRLAGLVSLREESRLALVRSIRDADAGIRGLALIAVGRQKMTEALPELVLSVGREGLEHARHAAGALAAMPPGGWLALEELRASSNPVAALAAREALARARREA